jgi:hypothetical protein
MVFSPVNITSVTKPEKLPVNRSGFKFVSHNSHMRDSYLVFALPLINISKTFQ